MENLWDPTKADLNWTFIGVQSYLKKKKKEKKKKRKSSNKLTSHPKQLGKNDKQNPILIEKKKL